MDRIMDVECMAPDFVYRIEKNLNSSTAFYILVVAQTIDKYREGQIKLARNEQFFLKT